MREKHSDILFALYTNGGEGTVDWLAGLSASGTEAETRQSIWLLASANLIKVRMEDDTAYATLTERGEECALGAADLIASSMLRDWHQIVA